MGQMVACVTCRQTVPVEQTDIVGQGYRCTPCSQRAVVDQLSGKSRSSDHFTSAERGYLHRSGTKMIVVGAVGLLAGALIAVAAIADLSIGVAIAGGMLALTSAGGMSFGFARRKAAR